MGSIVSEAKRRFNLYMSGEDSKAVHPNLRGAIFRIAISKGGRAEYDAVKNEYLRTTSVDGKEICLQSMAQVPTSELTLEYLDFLFSDKVALQDKHSGAAAVAGNSKVRLSLWRYIKEHWDTVHSILSGNAVVFDRLLRMSLKEFASHEIEKEIADFFQDKDNRGYDRSLGVIADTIRSRANYKERDEKLVQEWLDAHGYA